MQADQRRRGTMGRNVGLTIALTGALLAAGGLTASADGTETLGAPSIPIATGTDVDVGGVGLHDGPGTIDVEVPAGSAISQVIVYWEGHHSAPDAGADAVIELNGNPVTGTLIGGPTLFFGGTKNPHWSSTYRADVTALGLITDGANSVAVGGLSFDRVSNGAGIVVISDDGGTAADIELRDGNDLAYFDFAAPLDATVTQVFTFDPAPVDRTIDLSLFASSVAGPDFPGERPNVIEVIVDGNATRYQNLLGSFDGDEWDTIELLIDLPAGVGSFSVQAISANDNPQTDNRPASLAWLVAASAVPPYVPPTTTTTTTTTLPETTTTVAETTTTTTVPETTTTMAETTTTVAETTTTVEINPPTTTTTLPCEWDPDLEPDDPNCFQGTTTSVQVAPPTTTSTGGNSPTTTLAELPRTGPGSSSTMIALGALLILIGGVMVLSTRRDHGIA